MRPTCSLEIMPANAGGMLNSDLLGWDECCAAFAIQKLIFAQVKPPLPCMHAVFVWWFSASVVVASAVQDHAHCV